MNKYSDRSERELRSCDDRLQMVFDAVLPHIDHAILKGMRGEDEQNEAFEKGVSTKKWPDSKHNTLPSVAVDVAPSPVDWKDTNRFYFFAGFVLATAKSMGIDLRWGGDWDDDKDLKDQLLYDLVHFELKNP